MEGDSRSYEKLFGVLREFHNISGLKLNFEKACDIWIGSKRKCAEKLLPHLNVSWNPPEFRIFGLWFTNNLSDVAELNMTDKFIEVKKLFSIWVKRTITPCGRVAVLKSLILSKLVYLWIILGRVAVLQSLILSKLVYL